MADVTWLPTEEGTHAVVMGDLVTLCGEPGFLRSTTPEPGPNVCAKCRELIGAMAAALETERCDCGHLVESHCLAIDTLSCAGGGGCHACRCSRVREYWTGYGVGHA